MNKIFLVLLAAALLIIIPACAAPLPESPSLTAVPLSEIPRVSVQESKAAFDNGEAVFVDVRGVDSYAESHISGALSIPLAEVEIRLNELDPDRWFITYCT